MIISTNEYEPSVASLKRVSIVAGIQTDGY